MTKDNSALFNLIANAPVGGWADALKQYAMMRGLMVEAALRLSFDLQASENFTFETRMATLDLINRLTAAIGDENLVKATLAIVNWPKK